MPLFGLMGYKTSQLTTAMLNFGDVSISKVIKILDQLLGH